MDIQEIQKLIKFVAKSGVSKVKLKTEKLDITIKTGTSSSEKVATQTVHKEILPQVETISPLAQKEDSKPKQEKNDSNYITIKSPIIGTFFRRPSPNKPNFIEVGSIIKAGDTICIIEAMKLFNEIESEVSGTVIKILVDDSSPVEFDQPIILVDPS